MSGFQSDSLAVMQRSLVPAETSRLSGRRSDGVPVYTYARRPDAPPVSVGRFSAADLLAAGAADVHAHAHDFLVLAYFERGRGAIRLDDQQWPVAAGDAFVIAPGEVVRAGGHGHDPAAKGWCVFFPPEIIASGMLGGSLGWGAHPLLFPFVGRSAGGAQRLRVPPSERAAWSRHVAAIERELRQPRDGSSEAALAHLTLLLVSVARITVDLGNDLRLRSEPLMAAVFEFIEEHYNEPISLADIAAAVGLTPGHLTTVVRRQDRAHRAAMDHRTPNGGSSPAATRDRPHGRGDRDRRRLPASELLHQAVPTQSRRHAGRVAPQHPHLDPSGCLDAHPLPLTHDPITLTAVRSGTTSPVSRSHRRSHSSAPRTRRAPARVVGAPTGCKPVRAAWFGSAAKERPGTRRDPVRLRAPRTGR
jgi:AraC family transcriptional activator of pobA